MPPSPQSTDNSSEYIIYLVAIIGVYLGIGMFYESHREIFNTIIMGINKIELYLFAFIPESNAAAVMRTAAWDDPGRYDFGKMVQLTEITGKYIRYPFSLFIAILIFRSYKHHGVSERYMQVYNMKTLVQNNVQGFPCMAPVASRNLLDEPYDKGPWRIARTPLQFVAENGLIVDKNGAPIPKNVFIHPVTGFADIKSTVLRNGKNKEFRLDKKRTKEIMTEQLGPAFTGVENLPDYQQALAACFMSFIGGEKKQGQALLDKMSLSFVEGTEANNMTDMKIDLSNYQDLIKEFQNNEYVLQATQYHNSYEKVWMMALLSAARRKGVLASSQFIWLRPTDRGLWYALNQVGGSTSWSEATGPWSHYKIEEMAKMSLHEPELEPAINGFEHAIKLTGFLFNPDIK